MTDRILGLLGLMRKASAICPGEDAASEAVLAGKARLLLLPADAPPRKIERADRYLEGRSCLKVMLPYPESCLSEAVGTGGCTMAAVTDMGFADALMQLLTGQDPLRYGNAAKKLHCRLDKQKRRKTEKPGGASAAEKNACSEKKIYSGKKKMPAELPAAAGKSTAVGKNATGRKSIAAGKSTAYRKNTVDRKSTVDRKNAANRRNTVDRKKADNRRSASPGMTNGNK